MDLESGQQVYNDIRNNPAYNLTDGGVDSSIYSDPKAMFELLGAGRPGGLPMPTMLDATVVRSRSRTMSSEIFRSWKLLNAMIQRHEATIQKRWLKRTSKPLSELDFNCEHLTERTVDRSQPK